LFPQAQDAAKFPQSCSGFPQAAGLLLAIIALISENTIYLKSSSDTRVPFHFCPDSIRFRKSRRLPKTHLENWSFGGYLCPAGFLWKQLRDFGISKVPSRKPCGKRLIYENSG
jgi:hypothetical protein